MDVPPHQRVTGFPSADIILTAAIALVSLLVIALVLALSAEPRVHGRTLETIAKARAVRESSLALAQATALYQAARVEHLSDALGARAMQERAGESVREEVSALRRVAGEDADLLAIVNRISTAVDTRLLAGDQTSRAPLEDLNAELAELSRVVNRNNDIARATEDQLRLRLNAISIALAALSLLASGLATLALRREREQWRLAYAIAEAAGTRALQSDEAKTRFLTAASHDMRQPLHALTLYLSALSRRVDGAEARNILEKADRAAQSLVGMFGVLFDLARIEANAITPEFSDVSVQALFERVANEHPGAAITIAPTGAYVRSDAVLLQQILRNLTSNALRHGGGRVFLSASTMDDRVTISVRDDGPGIALQDRERIFDEFVRLQPGASKEGLGLGLSIVRRLASLLGHEISLRSENGQGAEFTITAQRADAVAEIVSPQGSAILANADVLALDDDALALSAIVGALTDMGARVRACSKVADVETALASGYAPRFAVLDLQINGVAKAFNVADQLLARVKPPPRIVIISASTSSETLSALRTSGHRWVVKPVDSQALIEAFG